MKIYAYGSFNGFKPVLAAEELGIDYEYVHVNLGAGEQRKPEHLARHPLGKIPVLEHNGHCITESNSICRYLSNISDQKLYSKDPLQAAKIDQMIDTITLHVGRWIASYFWQEIVRKNIMGQEVDAAALKEADGFLATTLPYLDAELGKNTFLCGNDLTLADVIAITYFDISETTSFSFDQYKNIVRWYQSMRERPAFARARQRMAA